VTRIGQPFGTLGGGIDAITGVQTPGDGGGYGDLFVGSGDGNLYSLDSEDGTKKWATSIGSISSSVTPSAEGENTNLYLTTDAGDVYEVSREGSVVHYDAFASDYDPCTIPAVTGNRLYFSKYYRPDVNSEMNAYNLDDEYASGWADDVWSNETQVAGNVKEQPALVDGTLYVKTSGRGTYDDPGASAVDAETGDVLWNYQLGFLNEAFGSLTVGEDKVYLGDTTGSLVALDRSDGSVEWNFSPGAASFMSAPTLVDDTLYAGQGFAGALLFAVDAEDGSEIWSLGDTGDIFTTPAVFGNLLYVGSVDGNLYAVRSSDGSVAWEFSTGGEVRGSPAVAGSTVYFGSKDGNVYAVGAYSGEEKWKFSTGGAVEAAPFVEDAEWTYADRPGRYRAA
jgi:outer membrane protein assembly factor BamB